jgi:cell division protein FtsB
VSTHAPTLFERHRPKSSAIQYGLAAVVALLILSLWLHFFLALEIEGIGRDIGAKAEELERLQRANLATMGQITVLESERRMASEATAMGFRLQQPLYLTVNRTLARPAAQAAESAFLTIWTFGAGREAAADQAAEQHPEEPAEAALSVANLP